MGEVEKFSVEVKGVSICDLDISIKRVSRRILKRKTGETHGKFRTGYERSRRSADRSGG